MKAKNYILLGSLILAIGLIMYVLLPSGIKGVRVAGSFLMLLGFMILFIGIISIPMTKVKRSESS